jgi:phosphatidylglycerophosphatase A
MKFVVRLLSSGFFSGYVPRGSGTAASLLSCIAWMLLSHGKAYPVVVLVVTVTGFIICGYAERVVYGEKDSSKIVIDEIAGMLLTFSTFTFAWNAQGMFYLASGFLFFRFFDIVKPVPIRTLQNIRGGAGIMLDDIGSAVIANGLLQIMRLVIFK